MRLVIAALQRRDRPTATHLASRTRHSPHHGRAGDGRPVRRRLDCAVRGSFQRGAPNPLVDGNDEDDGQMRRLEKDDASPTELIVGGQKQAEWTEDDEGQQVEWRVKVRESVASRRFEHVDTVDEEILLARMRDDTREAVGEHTGERAHQQDGAKHDEEDHERGTENGVNLAHDVEPDKGRAEEDLGEEPSHVSQRERVAPDQREGREEAEVDNDDQNHKLDKVLCHLLEARDQSTPVRTKAEDRADARDHEQSFQCQYVKR